MIVGLTGPAGSGKSYVSGYLESEGFDNYQLESLASVLKRSAGQLFNLSGEQLYGKDKSKPDENGVTPREYLQGLGDHCKDSYGDDFFAKSLLKRIEGRAKGSKVVIDDVRFLCEAEAIRAAGGIVIGVRRPFIFDYAVERANDGTLHRSEAEMVQNWHQMCDFEISNDVEGKNLKVLNGEITPEEAEVLAELVRFKPLLDWCEFWLDSEPFDRNEVPVHLRNLYNVFSLNPFLLELS